MLFRSGVGDLEAFAAVVYSSNWETEIMPMGEAVKEDKASAVEEELLVGGQIVGDVEKEDAFESAWGKATDKRA